jgi:hypothetical protein
MPWFKNKMKHMETTNIVYRKIKELSAVAGRPRSPIAIPILCRELAMPDDAVKPVIKYLIELRLIKYYEPAKQSIQLTLLGSAVTR